MGALHKEIVLLRPVVALKVNLFHLNIAECLRNQYASGITLVIVSFIPDKFDASPAFM